MPISSFADYLPTIDDFLAHWALVDALEVLTVPVDNLGVSQSDLSNLRSQLDAQKSLVEIHLNTLEISRITANQVREVATARLSEFNRRIRAQFPNSPHFSKLPAVPAPTSGRDAFLTAMDDAKDLWTRVNAMVPSASFTAPLLLQGGFTLAAFTANRAALDSAFSARATAGTQLNTTRTDRDLLQQNALRILSGYRAMVTALYPAASSFVLTLPRLYPLPGHTPDPVEASGHWVPAATQAEITWHPSAEPDLKDYQLRAVPGLEYTADDATTLHTFPPAAPRTFLTGAGFAIPGAAMTYKLFVRLQTGNEVGSAALTVTRPT